MFWGEFIMFVFFLPVWANLIFKFNFQTNFAIKFSNFHQKLSEFHQQDQLFIQN